MSQGLHFYILDLETTGLSTKLKHEIIELSVIRFVDRVQLSRQVKANFPKFASLDALKITGKTMEDLKKGVSKVQMMDDFEKFLLRDGLTPAHRVIVGHNIGFDRGFMHHLWKEYQRDFQADIWLDTMAMTRRLISKLAEGKRKVNLEAAMDFFGLKKVAGLHTAQGDTRNTFRLFEHLLNSGIPYLDLLKNIPMRKFPEPAGSSDDEELLDLLDESED